MQGGPGGRQGAIGRPAQSETPGPTLHGEYVVADGNGGFRTDLTQSGTVTAISPTSITVRSQDGFSQTYVIPNTAGDAAAPFAVDDQVVIGATRDGQTATITNIGNPLSDLGGSGTGGPPPHHN
jgi:hypothetical protein